MKLKLSNLIIGAGLAITMLSCHSETPSTKNAKQKASSLKVDAFIVKPVVMDQSITVSGTLIPFEETVLMSDVAGRVVSINLPEGGTVKQGTILVKLFDGDLQAQLQKAQAQLEIAEQTLKRQAELLKVNGISQADYDQAALQANSSKADIEVLKAQIRKTEVQAPFDGTIGLRNISLGAQVAPSTPLVTIRAIHQLKLDFSIPEKYSTQIKPGTKVNFLVQGDEKKYEATVMATEEGIDIDTRNLKVRAIVNGSSNHLIPGAFADVILKLNENKQALMIPTQAIIPSEQNKSVIVAKNGKAHFTLVKTGVRKASAIEVTEGLHPGDTIITSGILFLKEKTKLFYATIKTDSL
jgi:membrane fusion protein (multidrug efflux system)